MANPTLQVPSSFIAPHAIAFPARDAHASSLDRRVMPISTYTLAILLATLPILRCTCLVHVLFLFGSFCSRLVLFDPIWPWLVLIGHLFYFCLALFGSYFYHGCFQSCFHFLHYDFHLCIVDSMWKINRDNQLQYMGRCCWALVPRLRLCWSLDNLGEGYSHLRTIPWEAIDSSLCNFLWFTLGPNLQQQFQAFLTCYEIWNKAKKVHSNDAHCLYNVTTSLMNMDMQPTLISLNI